MKLIDAQHIAQDLVTRLSPACERIEIAGSIRRGKPDVNDIEIVAIPRTEPELNLFDEEIGQISLLDSVLADLIKEDILAPGAKAGQRHKQYEVNGRGITLDLFLVVPPAQWGAILAIRTGPWEFSRWLVTERSKGGAMPAPLQQRDGALHDYLGRVVETPEEADYFRILGLPWIPPAQRRPKWGTPQRAYEE